MITKIVQTQEEPGCQTIWAPFAQCAIHCRGLAGVFRVRTYRFCSKKGVYDTFSLRGGTLPGACGGFSGQNVSFLLKKTGVTIRFHFESARCRDLRGLFGSERIVFAQKTGVTIRFHFGVALCRGLAGAFRVRTYRFCSKKRGLRYFLIFTATFLPALSTLHGVGNLSNINSTNAGGVRLPDHMGSFCDVCGSPSLASDRSGRLTRLVQGLPPDRSA